MIKLKELIKEETKHSCDCGGDCCAIHENMVPGKVFTGHGFAFRKEELQNSQGEQTDFKKGDVVKDINPDCPHHGSEGEVKKVGKGTITFVVSNTGKNYQQGDELEKTVDQMVKLKESDLGLTYKKGKTVKVKHKKSGKELVIVDKPNVKREYEKIGYFAEGKVNEKISKEEWAEYPKYASKLKPYMQKLLKVRLKVRVIKQANHNPWIEIRVARFGKDIIPNDFRKKALKAIGGGRPRDMDNITYGNITAGSVSMKHDQWVKLLGNKVKSESVNEGKWSKIMTSVRKGSKSGPWSIVVYKGKKVLHQRLVKILQQIPAHYEEVKKKYPRAKIGIEDKYGERVYTESVKENLIYVDKDMEDGKFDEKNPQVHIVGYGVMSMKTIREKLFRVFKELSMRAKKGEIENVNSYLKGSGVVLALLKAYLEAKKQLKSSSMKRKITMYKRKR